MIHSCRIVCRKKTNIIYLDKLYFLFIYKPEKDGIIEYIRKLSKYTIYRGRRMGRLVEFQNVKKTYHMGEVEIHAVDGVDFEINEGASCHCLWGFLPFSLGSDGKNRPSRNG